MSSTAFDPKKFYLSMEGRVGRPDFSLKLVLPIFITWLGVGYARSRGNMMVAPVLSLLLLWPVIVVTAKRFHDRGKSGWWQMIAFLPGGWIWILSGIDDLARSRGVVINLGLIWAYAGLWVLVETWFLKGAEGDNRFGPPPV